MTATNTAGRPIGKTGQAQATREPPLSSNVLSGSNATREITSPKVQAGVHRQAVPAFSNILDITDLHPLIGNNTQGSVRHKEHKATAVPVEVLIAVAVAVDVAADLIWAAVYNYLEQGVAKKKRSVSAEERHALLFVRL